MTLHRTTVYQQPGRFAGWPANYGTWAWGPEILTQFVVGWVAPQDGLHPRDVTRPFEVVQARSLDRGETWSHEPFTGAIPAGAATLSGDEHVEESLRVGPRLREEDFVPLESPIDFLDEETLVLCARTDLDSGSSSWFYVSTDRGTQWSGPHRLPHFGFAGTSARTDVVPLSSSSALFLLNGTKSDGGEGRVFASRTDDGGRSFRFVSYVGEEPEGWTIMPSTVCLPDGTLLTALRCSGPGTPGSPDSHWIDVYVSADEGENWGLRARAVQCAGHGGNPPALVRLEDGRLVLHYGFRDEPRGLRASVSADDGSTWSDPIILTDDTATHDMGYPRAVLLDDGEVFVSYYSNSGPLSERSIESVRWRP